MKNYLLKRVKYLMRKWGHLLIPFFLQDFINLSSKTNSIRDKELNLANATLNQLFK